MTLGKLLNLSSLRFFTFWKEDRHDNIIELFLNLSEILYIEHLRQILANNNGSKF